MANYNIDAIYNGNTSLPGTERVRIDSSGNIGIGTATPSTKLHIYENANRVTYISQNNNHTARFEAYGTATAIDTTASNGIFFRINSGDIVKFAADGNVGIGTSTAGAPLHIYRASNPWIRLNGGGAFSYIQLDDGTSYGYLLKNTSSDTSNGALAGALYTYTDSGKAFQHIHSGTPLFTILSGGNVGVGTTSPSEALYVLKASGDSSATFKTASGGAEINLDATNGYAALKIYSSGTEKWRIGQINDSTNFQIWQSGTGARLYINSSGNVGIGTTSPGAKLVVIGETQISSNSAYTTHLNYQDAGINFITMANGGYTDFRGSSNNVTTMRVKGDGNVGIGTSTINYRLEVYNSGAENVAKFRGANDSTIIIGGSDTGGSGEQYITYQNVTTATNAWMVGMDDGEDFRFAYGAAGEITDGNALIKIGQDGNLGVGTVSAGYKLQVAGDSYITNALKNGLVETRSFSTSFTNGVANRAADIRFPNSYINGLIEIEVTAGYNNQNSVGVVKKIFSVGANPNNTIWNSAVARVVEAHGATVNNWTIGDFAWDATNSKYIIPIYHIVSTGNLLNINIRYFSEGAVSSPILPTTTLSAEYTATIPAAYQTRHYVYYNDNVGIGTTSPNDKLDVVGRVYAYRYIAVSSNASSPAYATDTSTGMFNAGTNIIGFSISGTEKLRIDSNGNVGIGTTSPAQKLDVAGSARFTNIVYAAKGILSDSSGVNPVLEVYNTVATNAATAIIRQTTAGGNGNQDIGLLVDIQGAGDSDRIANFRYYDGSTYTSRMAILRSGNVGIGTTSPVTKLHVEQVQNAESLITLRNNRQDLGDVPIFGISAQNSVTDVAKISFYRGGGGNSGYLTFSTKFDNASSLTEKVRIDGAGNVGIGTTSPGAKLVVQGGSTTDAVLLADKQTTGDGRVATFVNTNASGYSSYIYIGSSPGTDWKLGKNVTNAASNADFNITDHNNNNRFHIKSADGNVGIGTTTPTQKLEVAGYVMAGESSYRTSIYGNSGGAWIGFGDTSNTVSLGRIGAYGSLFNINSINGDTSFQYNGSEKMRITTGGNVGIGTTSPVSKLHVVGEGDTVTLQKSNNVPALAFLGTSTNKSVIEGGDNFNFYTGGSSRFYIKNDGNVGIGTTSPTNKLEVDGGSSAVTLRVSTTNTGAGVASLILANSSKTANNDGVKISHGAGYTNITDLNSTNIMTWDMSNTRVGIGTTSPSTPLHVFNTAATLATFTRDLATDVGFSIGADSNGTIFSTAGAHAYLFYTNGTEKVRITSDGNLGIGTTSVSSKLQIGNGTSNTYSSVAQLSGDSGGASTLIALSLVNSRGAVTGNGVGIDFHNAGNYSATGRISVVQAGSVTTDSEMQFFVYNDSITQRMVLNYLGNLGIGTTSPITKLHVAGTTSIIPTYDSGSGYSYFLRMGYDTSGSYDYTIKRNGTTGFLEFNGTQGSPYVSYVFAGGDVYSGASGGTIGGFYFNSSSHGIRRATGTNDVYCFTTSGTLYLGAGGSSTTHVRVLSGGDVGIGVSPSYKLDVNGNIHGTGFPTSSDVRFKKNITPLQNSLEKIKKLQGVKYEWNEFVNSRRDGYKLNIPIIGLIAQDVEQVVPEIVDHWKLSEDCQDARSIDYPRLIPLLIEAMKEQQNQIEELRNEIKSLKSN